MTDPRRRDGCLGDEALLLAADLRASLLSPEDRAHLETCEDCVARLADEALLHRRVDEAVLRTRSRAAGPIAIALALAAAFAVPAYATEIRRLSFVEDLTALAEAAAASLRAADLLATQRTSLFAVFALVLAATSFVVLSRTRKVSS